MNAYLWFNRDGTQRCRWWWFSSHWDRSQSACRKSPTTKTSKMAKLGEFWEYLVSRMKQRSHGNRFLKYCLHTHAHTDCFQVKLFPDLCMRALWRAFGRLLAADFWIERKSFTTNHPQPNMRHKPTFWTSMLWSSLGLCLTWLFWLPWSSWATPATKFNVCCKTFGVATSVLTSSGWLRLVHLGAIPTRVLLAKCLRHEYDRLVSSATVLDSWPLGTIQKRGV